MVIHRHRQGALRALLADDILTQDIEDLFRFGNGSEIVELIAGVDLPLDHIVAQVYAFHADTAVQSEDQFGNLLARFPAQHAAPHLVAIDRGSWWHSVFPYCACGVIVRSSRTITRSTSP